MGKWGEVVLAGDLSSGAACGPVYSEMSSPRAKLEGTLTAAIQSIFTLSCPELTPSQSR